MMQVTEGKHTSGTSIWIPNTGTKMEKSRYLTSKSLLITMPHQNELLNRKSNPMLDKIVNSAASQFSGQLLQLGSISFVWFGVEFDFNSLAIFVGLMFSFIGLLISIHSARIHKQTSKKEEELAVLEMEKILMEKKVLEQEHPELFKKKK